ncbi:MAG: hypothetical protein ACRD1T_09510 [Acidimicrobiia bacterium]
MRTTLALILAPLTTAGLISLSGFFDRGASFIGSLRMLNSLGSEQPMSQFTRTTRSGVVLIVVGVAGGIPAAVGLLPGGPLVLPGSLVACLVGRRLMVGRRDVRDIAWTTVVIWCIAAGVLRFETLDPAEALAAQSALGPGPLLGPRLASASSALALVAGLAAVHIWSRTIAESPPSEHSARLSRILSWGETSLGATAVSATLWGPSLGALVYGPPLELDSWLWVIASMAVTIGSIAAICLVSKGLTRLEADDSQSKLVSYVSAAVPVAAFLAVVFSGVAS